MDLPLIMMLIPILTLEFDADHNDDKVKQQ
jgi:hypothetical protein